MPQDPNLYGQRAPKKPKRDATLSSTLDFTAQLTSLMSNAKNADGPASGTSRAPKAASKNGGLFRTAGKQDNAKSKQVEGENLVLKETTGTEAEAQERAWAKRKMEAKARLYAAMKRGDYVAKDNEAAPLVDFDRKWAENVEGKEDYSGSSSDEEDENDIAKEELVEYEDDFGRTRMVTRAKKEKMERRERIGLIGAEELERMSARPKAPDNIIYGDTVQSMAFVPADVDGMEALARKRDRSATPPQLKHYDADWEIRTKGTGFYKFSQDADTRGEEMKNLEEERKQTEKQRRDRENEREARKREIEDRRNEMARRRAQKQADRFLDGLVDG